ncbi:uncharacterized protein HMPREF1541_10872 [Cyphellophora europaea CBS 101466]|uniref:Uncharacterized protein n=1 Tax=Cyphellophora europaea (strain CBS 101466) TaxID=1220924 RepID=W2S5P5_CYPE1|nr:uncharacterized protein HMPREF1541_10872 [Cyphellophora europaea CBS 101466]ETN44007.1 hypothetical protein HMPREF1541_10872 [Cyphellophora europaea CBS 101466]
MVVRPPSYKARRFCRSIEWTKFSRSMRIMDMLWWNLV